MKILTTALVLIAALVLPGCQNFATQGFPVVATLDVHSVDGYPLVGRTDGRTYLVKADVDLTLRLVDKASGVPLVLYTVAAGKVALISKPRDFRETFEANEPLPIWVLELFPDGGRLMAEEMGFVIEPDPGTAP